MFSPEVRAAVIQLVNGVAFHPTIPVPLPSGLELPTGPGHRSTSGCGPAAIYPPLWYTTAALAYRAADDRALLQRLLAVRWMSVAWGSVVAVAALGVGLLMVGTLSGAVLYALIVALQPMTGALEAVANPEAAALACSSGVLAMIAALWRGVAWRRSVVTLVVLLALGVLAKPTFVLALPTFATLTLLAVHHGTRHPYRFVGAVFSLPLLVTVGFALSGGQRTGLYDEIAASGTLAQQIYRHLLNPKRLFDVWAEQYWGKLGWMDAQPQRGWYVALVVTSAIALVALPAVRRHRAREEALLWIVGGGSMLFALALYGIAWRRGDLLWVQGRHILLLFPAHAYLIVRGLGVMRARLPRALDPVMLFVLLLAAVNGALAVAGARRFYGPSPWRGIMAWQDAWNVPLLGAALGATVALAALLVGWSASVRWRASAGESRSA